MPQVMIGLSARDYHTTNEVWRLAKRHLNPAVRRRIGWRGRSSFLRQLILYGFEKERGSGPPTRPVPGEPDAPVRTGVSMGRHVERLEGLALVGNATIADLPVRTPDLIESRRVPAEGPGLTLRSLDAPLGSRHLELSDGDRRVDIEYVVPAPEVVGPVGGATPAGSSALLVRPPLPKDLPDTLRSARPDLLVWGNARALWSEGRPFIEAIRQLRATFGAAPLLWAPRVALPHRIPLLAYLGVDLVDTTAGLLAAARGEYLDETLGRTDREIARTEGRCGCPSCRSDPMGSLDVHATAVYQRAMSECRTAARTGRLRELVEARLPAEPVLAEMLRYADHDLGGLLEERLPITATDSHAYVLLEAHRRPEMARFRERLLSRYLPPPTKSVLLLVPCSRTKPYRLSRSHRRFYAALDGLYPSERVHVVSVSSPIGIVPRELEDVPPARHYDIPVTGDWEERERASVVDGVRHLLSAGRYRAIVVHLDPNEYSFLRSAIPAEIPSAWTLGDHRSTAPEALAALRAAVGAALDGEKPVPGGPLAVVREELHEVAAVQFGRAAADRLFAAPVRLAGRPWFQRLTDGHTDLATLREERGWFHLTVAGARRLVPDPPLSVSVDPSLPLTGDLFVPGVRDADPAIRLGDSVVLLRDGSLAAVGEAVLPGRLMRELDHGLAVRVRHRAHGPTDTSLTDEASLRTPGPVV
jgi:archaeosine synthase